jgi:hypothetical protein
MIGETGKKLFFFLKESNEKKRIELPYVNLPCSRPRI